MTTEKKRPHAPEGQFQKEVQETAQRIWLAGLGALAVAEQEGSKLFKSLVAKGEEVETKGKEKVEKLRIDVDAELGKARAKANEAWEKLEGSFDEKLAAALHRMGVPTRDEIRNLTRRVEELNASVERLKPKAKPAGRSGEASSKNA